MKAVLLNGSPRKDWNTHRMLMEAERGAKDAGAETEMVHLFDLDYTDCKACFACKRRGNRTNGVCALRDGLRPVLESIHDAEVVVIGSPVYYSNMTAETVALINRMMFPTMHYEDDGSRDVLLPVKKRCGLVGTMNVSEEQASKYCGAYETAASLIRTFFGSCETLYACDTYQFTDYSKYYAGMWDERHKAEHRERQFPIDLQRAYELGRRLVEQSRATE